MPDAGGIHSGVEEGVLATGAVVAAEEGLALAPAAAAGQHRAGLGDEIRRVLDQARVHAEDRAKSALDLFGRVVAGLEDAHGRVDQVAEGGDVEGGCPAEVNRRIHRPVSYRDPDTRAATATIAFAATTGLEAMAMPYAIQSSAASACTRRSAAPLRNR